MVSHTVLVFFVPSVMAVFCPWAHNILVVVYSNIVDDALWELSYHRV